MVLDFPEIGSRKFFDDPIAILFIGDARPVDREIGNIRGGFVLHEPDEEGGTANHDNDRKSDTPEKT